MIDYNHNGDLPQEWDGGCTDTTCEHCIDYKCHSENEQCTYEPILEDLND